MPRDDQHQPEEVLDRHDAVAHALRDVLKNGEEFLVRCREGDVEVEHSTSTWFRKQHPRLYGRLLIVEEQIPHVSSNLLLPILIAGSLMAIGLQAGWWDGILGGPQMGDQLRTWWIYVLLAVVGFFLFGWLGEFFDKRAFRRNRNSLAQLLESDNLSREELVNQLQEDPNLKNVLKYLKLDPHFDSRPPGG